MPDSFERSALTIAEAAASLGVGVSTIRREIARGALPARRIGVGRGRIRIDPAALAAYGRPVEATR